MSNTGKNVQDTGKQSVDLEDQHTPPKENAPGEAADAQASSQDASAQEPPQEPQPQGQENQSQSEEQTQEEGGSSQAASADAAGEAAPSGEESAEDEAPAFEWGDGLDLHITNDKMKAKLTVSVEHAGNYNPASLKHYLSENRIEHGIQEELLEQIFTDDLFNQALDVAVGTPVEHGKDGYVDWQVDLSVLDGAALIERGGRVNYKERHHVLQVEEDQVLAQLVDPTEGAPGKNIMGEPVEPRPGKAAKLPGGKNVNYSEDGHEMRAAIKGVVCREGERVSISDVLNIQGDVDYNTGNITVDKTVVITGGVLSDFEINAGQDVHINGLVEAANITAKGNIYMTGGIQGGEKAVITASGDINVKFVNGATLKAEGSIYTQGPVMQSDLTAGERIHLDGQKGIIMGCTASAEKEINAEIIGSEKEAKNHLMVGNSVSEILNRKRAEKQKAESLKQNYDKLRSAVDQIDQAKKKGKKVPPQQEQLRLKIIRSGLQLKAQIKQVQDEMKSLDAHVQQMRQEMRGVIARSIAHPGTRIDVMGYTHIVRQPTSKSQFMVMSKKEVEIFAFTSGEEAKKQSGEKKKEEG